MSYGKNPTLKYCSVEVTISEVQVKQMDKNVEEKAKTHLTVHALVKSRILRRGGITGRIHYKGFGNRNRSRKNKSAADETGPSSVVKMNRRWNDGVYEKREWVRGGGMGFSYRDCRQGTIQRKQRRRGWSISCKPGTFCGTVTQPRARTLQKAHAHTSDYRM